MKKIVKKIKAYVLVLAMVASVIGVMPMKAYAYDDEVDTGVAVVAWYVYDAEYCIYADGFYSIADYVGEWGDDGEGIMSSGSGFFVGALDENPEYFVTNCHCVDDYIASDEGGFGYMETGYTYEGYDIYLVYESSEIRIYYSEDEYDVAYIVDSGSVDKVDLAILNIADPTEERHALALCEPTEDMVGEEVWAVGFPGLGENDFSGASYWGVNDITVTSGSINRFVKASGSGVERIQMDAVIQHGNSGGPLVNEDGCVVGINTNGWIEENEQNYYAINVTELISMLDKNDVPYVMGKSNVGLIVGIVIGAVALVAAVAVVAVLMTKKGKSNGNNTSAKAKSAATPAMAQAATSKMPMLRSMSPQHNGATYAIKNQAIMIGRDAARCTIAYKEGTAGVSGMHCSVEWKAEMNEFLVTDLKSSYGTYLMSGQRLQPNVPHRLKAGDSFYVGDKANVIRVEVN
ncbi:MAG: trypsin-like serine protease [Lachnospiraceae bacterium]|nr:trypsin-like serine protease [Lachnospiraceae bacterium]